MTHLVAESGGQWPRLPAAREEIDAEIEERCNEAEEEMQAVERLQDEWNVGCLDPRPKE